MRRTIQKGGPPMQNKHKNLIRLLWKEGILFFLSLLVIYQIATNLSVIGDHISNFFRIISPFLVGAIMAYFLSRPTTKIERQFKKAPQAFLRNNSRGFSVLTIVLIITVIITVIFNMLMPIVVENIIDFTSQLGLYSRSVIDWGNTLIVDLEQDNSWVLTIIPKEDLMNTFTNIFSVQGILSQVGAHAASVVTYIMALSSSILNAVISLIICLYSLIFKDSILLFFNRVANAFISNRKLDKVKFYLLRSNEFFYKFIVAQFLDACILGTLATIILTILGVEYAVMLGVMLGICNMIPYFGSLIGSGVTAIITIFTGGLQLALITALSLLILQQIDGNFIGPRIMGDALKLNPMLIIISITIGGAYFGILGMFLSVPAAAMLKLFVNDILSWREAKLAEKI